MRETLKSKLDSLDKCNKFWIMNVYNRSLIKDFVSTNLCLKHLIVYLDILKTI